MPLTIGIDLVSMSEVEEALRVHGERYLQRIYTDREIRDCGTDARLLAARFAAKEATMKALGRTDEPLPWRSIGVRRDAHGHPRLELTGRAATFARKRGVSQLSVSITQRRELAAAVVVAEARAAS
jgi:holo-[acyl-carrier protein] synthase